MTPAEARQALLDALTVERFTTHHPERPSPSPRRVSPAVPASRSTSPARNAGPPARPKHGAPVCAPPPHEPQPEGHHDRIR